MPALIICVYYDRPQIVRGALESLRRQTSRDWHLSFIDDGSPNPGEPIVREILSEHLDRITFYRCEDTKEQKLAQGGSRHGAFMNQAMAEAKVAPSDPVLVLCDDDALVETCVGNVVNWYQRNPGQVWSYGHVIPYDPSKGPPPWGAKTPRIWLNKTGTIAPACQVDSSQVTFRLEKIREIGYPSPMTSALDAAVFTEFHRRHGGCPFTGFTQQFKGVFNDQLGSRPIERRYSPNVK